MEYRAMVIGGSAGSFSVIMDILQNIPEEIPIPVILCLHRLKHVKNGMTDSLNTKSLIKVSEPFDKEKIMPGRVYVAPANYHLCVSMGNSFCLSTDEMVHSSRPAIDLLFETAAYVYKQKLIGILLSGANCDGGRGMKHIKDNGGLTIVQKPESCIMATMPLAALSLTTVDHQFDKDKLIDFIKHI